MLINKYFLIKYHAIILKDTIISALKLFLLQKIRRQCLGHENMECVPILFIVYTAVA